MNLPVFIGALVWTAARLLAMFSSRKAVDGFAAGMGVLFCFIGAVWTRLFGLDSRTSSFVLGGVFLLAAVSTLLRVRRSRDSAGR